MAAAQANRGRRSQDRRNRRGEGSAGRNACATTGAAPQRNFRRGQRAARELQPVSIGAPRRSKQATAKLTRKRQAGSNFGRPTPRGGGQAAAAMWTRWRKGPKVAVPAEAAGRACKRRFSGIGRATSSRFVRGTPASASWLGCCGAKQSEEAAVASRKRFRLCHDERCVTRGRGCKSCASTNLRT